MATLQKKIKLAFLVLFFGLAWSLPASPVRDSISGKVIVQGYERPYASEVEYLESDVNQFIDIWPQTGHEESLKVECGFMLIGSDRMKNYHVFIPSPNGSTWNFQEGPRLYRYYDGLRVACDGAKGITISNLGFKRRCDAEVLYSNHNTIEWNVDGISGSASRTYYIKGNKVIRLFGDVKTNLTGRIYYFRLYIDGVLVRDLVPFRLGDVGCMYDKVSGDMLFNDGDGEFILGPDL